MGNIARRQKKRTVMNYNMNYKTNNMSKAINDKAQEAYVAPACAELPICAGSAICETSFTDGGIQPGTGSDWGLI